MEGGLPNLGCLAFATPRLRPPAECLHTREPVIHNDYASLAHKRGLPDGHVPVVREIVVPVFERGRIVALVGVGNRECEYDEFDVHQMTLLAENMWVTIERRRAEEALRESEQALAIRNRIANIFLTIPDDDMYGEVLPVILEVMESKYGVFGYLDENGHFVVPSMTRHIWDGCAVSDKRFVFRRETWGDSSWPRAIREKRVIYSNEPSTNVPEGHIPIQRHISLPILYQGEVIGLFQVANKETDYDADDVRMLESIANHIAPILYARLQRDKWQTGLKRAVDALRENEEILAKAQAIAHVGHWQWDVEANKMIGSDEFYRLFSVAPKELATYEAFLELVHRDDREAVVKGVEDALNKVKHYDIEYRIVCPDGAERAIHAQGEVFFDEADQPTRMLGTVQDVTERKQAEETLRLQSSALESAANAIVITDRDGRINWVNPAFTKLTGYGLEEVVGQNPRALKSGHHDEAFYRDMWRTIASGRIWHGELVNRHRDGTLYTEEMTITPVRDGSGEISHFIAVKHDVTARKQAEEALQKAKAAADAANAAKSGFLANMSHELRTPLNGVIAMTELLLGTDLDPKQRRHAWLAKSSGETLLALVNDILDFSKIEAGKLELEVRDFDLPYVLENVAANLASQAENKNLELMCSVHPSVPRRLRGDPARLQQIVTNLTGNAIKFTEQGEVILRATVDDESDQHVIVRIVITDTGIGIPRADQDRLFESFSQVDASTTRNYGGTGLGLAICKQLVELMKGQIGVESELGRGSTFWFTAKLEKLPESETQRRPALGDMRHLRILVVDDNATNREVVREQLAVAGLTIESASDGEEALTMLREAAGENTPFDLAILDMQMPGMDGEQLAQAIKADSTIRDAVLILLTSLGRCDDTERMKAMGFSGWLTKPARQSELLGAIAEAAACANTEPSQLLPDAERVVSRTTPIQHKARNAGARILLAEDNEISQEAAKELLARAGYRCDEVDNGKQAVDAMIEGGYDLILMDCQMPEMDGFEATHAIRQHEKDGALAGSSSSRIPIVALTANAIKGDRERCLKAGMDDYISKPLDSNRLIEVIDSQLSQSSARVEVSLGSSSEERQAEAEPGRSEVDYHSEAASPPFDTDALLKRWGADKAFANKLIAKFCKRAPSDLDQLEQYVNANNVEEATRLAHGLKGAASYVAAEAFRKAAAKLEELGRAGDLSNAAACLEALRAELKRCLEYHPEQPENVTQP